MATAKAAKKKFPQQAAGFVRPVDNYDPTLPKWARSLSGSQRDAYALISGSSSLTDLRA